MFDFEYRLRDRVKNAVINGLLIAGIFLGTSAAMSWMLAQQTVNFNVEKKGTVESSPTQIDEAWCVVRDPAMVTEFCHLVQEEIDEANN